MYTYIYMQNIIYTEFINNNFILQVRKTEILVEVTYAFCETGAYISKPAMLYFVVSWLDNVPTL